MLGACSRRPEKRFHADGDFEDSEEGADYAPPPVYSPGTEVLEDVLDTVLGTEEQVALSELSSMEL